MGSCDTWNIISAFAAVGSTLFAGLAFYKSKSVYNYLKEREKSDWTKKQIKVAFVDLNFDDMDDFYNDPTRLSGSLKNGIYRGYYHIHSPFFQVDDSDMKKMISDFYNKFYDIIWNEYKHVSTNADWYINKAYDENHGKERDEIITKLNKQVDDIYAIFKSLLEMLSKYKLDIKEISKYARESYKKPEF